ncbi:MAG: hypothetical protein IJ733_02735 [Lachnospiraceae bacterium]|nr:hypothetical protein [Lachnospiraceae bacterium]
MRKNDLIDAIGELNEELVERVNLLRQGEAQANAARKKRIRNWIIRMTVAVACLGLIMAGIRWRMTYYINRGLGSGTGSEDRKGAFYMSYEGPVFPLSLMGADSEITAERSLTFDFSPYISPSNAGEEKSIEDDSVDGDSYESESIITDSYLLRLTEGKKGSEAKKVICSYPFAASLSSALEKKPVIRVNEREVETELHIGPVFITFENTENGKEREGTDVSEPSSWKAYQAVIEAGYQGEAFDAFPDLSMPVTVYEVKNMYGESSGEAEAPTLNLEYRLNRKKTKILSYGFNGFNRNFESEPLAEESRSVFIEGGGSAYVIVLGEDIRDYKLLAYTDGGCEERMENAGGDVIRYETTLGEILARFAEEEWKEKANEIEKEKAFEQEDSGGYQQSRVTGEILSAISKEDFYHLTAELLAEKYGLVSKDSEMEDQTLDGFLEDIFSFTESSSRIMYLTFEVPVSGENAALVSASMVKEASIDYRDARTGGDAERNGYDMVTTLGSNLNFSKQCASVSHTEAVEIFSQDFGFDLEKGVTEVELDLKKEHYYIEVKRK